MINSLPRGYQALVIGASGGIGAAVAQMIESDSRCGGVVRLSRSNDAGFDITDEESVAAQARSLRRQNHTFALIFDATGALEIDGNGPEKSFSRLDPAVLARAFAINSIGPALLLKHFAPLLVREGKCIFASLSARVGSIGDNRLGGWYSYRASKAALNQILRTAAVEITRKRPEAVVAALHPGTVRTSLTEAYAGGRSTFSPDEAAAKLIDVLDRLEPAQSGGFFAYDGKAVPW